MQVVVLDRPRSPADFGPYEIGRKFAVLSQAVHTVHMTDALMKRGMKLAFLAIGVGVGFGFISRLLPANFQGFTWGFIAGLFLSLILFLGSWYRRSAESAETRPSPSTRSKRVRLLTAIGIAAGFFFAVLMPFLTEHIRSVIGGVLVGFIVMVGVVMSPLFCEPTKSVPPA